MGSGYFCGRGRGGGNGNRPGGRSHQNGSRFGSDWRDQIRSTRVGEAPVFNDRTDPKVCRRMLHDWVRFQDLADASSSKRLTLGQQVFAIVTSIQGSAGHRLEHITSMVHADMTRDEFTEVIDRILEVVDPIDRESSFLETAKAWSYLMRKGNGARQTYDCDWSEYSSWCVRYAKSHGKVAQSPGVQDLTALLCVLNARLGKTEFAMVLQAAMQYQGALKSHSDKSSIQKRQGSIVTGPRSAKGVLSQFSHRPDGVGREFTSTSDAHAEESTDVGQGKVDMPAKFSEMKIEMTDAMRRMFMMQQTLRYTHDDLPDGLENSIGVKIRSIRILLDANQDSRNKCGNVIYDLRAR